MMGDVGKQLAAGELRKLRRHEWRNVNHVTLRRARDVDHVLVGLGGPFAVETKWSATPWSQKPIHGRILDATAQPGTVSLTVFPAVFISRFLLPASGRRR
jgi:hypothetical protein